MLFRSALKSIKREPSYCMTTNNKTRTGAVPSGQTKPVSRVAHGLMTKTCTSCLQYSCTPDSVLLTLYPKQATEASVPACLPVHRSLFLLCLSVSAVSSQLSSLSHFRCSRKHWRTASGTGHLMLARNVVRLCVAFWGLPHRPIQTGGHALLNVAPKDVDRLRVLEVAEPDLEADHVRCTRA